MKHDPDFMDRLNRALRARKAAYRLLEVHESASEEELKRAFRRAAVACHPDHVGNTQQANRRFALIKCAYELLANDKPCEKLLDEAGSRTDAPEHDKYKLENPWGHFLWWRDKFFEP
jgi:DnaJ-class molecular chaperone